MTHKKKTCDISRGPVCGELRLTLFLNSEGEIYKMYGVEKRFQMCFKNYCHDLSAMFHLTS